MQKRNLVKNTSRKKHSRSKSEFEKPSPIDDAPKSANSNGKMPRADLLLKAQMASATARDNIIIDGKNKTFQDFAIEATQELYDEFAPRDPAEALLAAHAIALSNASMECFGQAAAWGEYPRVRDMNLRHGIRGAKTTADLLKQFYQHRALTSQEATATKSNRKERGETPKIQVGPRPVGRQNTYNWLYTTGGETSLARRNGKKLGWF